MTSTAKSNSDPQTATLPVRSAIQTPASAVWMVAGASSNDEDPRRAYFELRSMYSVGWPASPWRWLRFEFHTPLPGHRPCSMNGTLFRWATLWGAAHEEHGGLTTTRHGTSSLSAIRGARRLRLAAQLDSDYSAAVMVIFSLLDLFARFIPFQFGACSFEGISGGKRAPCKFTP
ncbi:hypothetical protein DFH09DRAFT_1331094 [Mycena vulgaris]|nr:hypothetical protein DFH09DRAFT_1331094 [Mycena vulgaris]